MLPFGINKIKIYLGVYTVNFLKLIVVYVVKVMKFKAWYKENIKENPSEQYRIRYVDILYFLEDDSISIVEPKVENSGLPQGLLSCVSCCSGFIID